MKTRGKKIEVSSKISGDERTRLRDIARNLKPEGCGLVVRTAAAGRSAYELRKDFEGLHSTWKDIKEHAKSAALAADENLEGEPYVMLHSAMNQTLSIVQDYFSEKVNAHSLLDHGLLVNHACFMPKLDYGVSESNQLS